MLAPFKRKLKKDFTKVSRVGLFFDFNLQHRSMYATFKLLARFCFQNRIMITQRQYNVNNCWGKQHKLANLRQKSYFKNKLKHSKRFDHVTDDVMSPLCSWKNYQVEHLSIRTISNIYNFKLYCIVYKWKAKYMSTIENYLQLWII